MNIRIYYSLIALSFLTACGGGGGGGGGDTGGGNTGGGGGGTTPAPTASISSSTGSVEVNTDFTLTWSSTNATSCTASGDWSDTIATSGTKTFSESSAGSKTYTITCTGAAGSATDSASVTVTDPAAPTATITSNVSSVLVNNSFTLTWSSTNATSCAASGSWSDSIATSGTQSVTETETGVETYTITCTGAGGSATDSAVVTVNPAESNTAFNGFAIDGYISGANIFIDQNFNFQQDDGEYTAVTNTDGSFTIETNDAAVFACLKKRPIVADVPVGAVDSTLGGVTEAYQMILPSVEDAGTSTIVISPFTSLFAEAIITGKNNSELTEDLTVAEGCESKGDTVASKISTAITAVKNSIETNFGITYDQLLGDFVANSTNEKVTEEVAQNIASILPTLKSIDNQISTFLTNKFGKEIRANVALGNDALDIIFGNEVYQSLPLSFSSRYETEKNNSGWWQTEEMKAFNGFISSDGKLSRKDCSETDTTGCDLSDITLDNVANTSTDYTKQSNFFNTDITFQNFDSSSLAVYARDSRSWRNNSENWLETDNRDRECQDDNSIQFQVTKNSYYTNYHYSTYSQGYGQFDCTNFRKYYTPMLNTAVIFNQSVNDNSIQAVYYIFDILRSGIISNPPFDFVENRLTIDPTNVIEEMALLPVFFKNVNGIRRKFNGDEYMQFEYHHSPLTSIFDYGTFPRNDSYRADFGSQQYYGQEARDAFYAKLQTEQTFTSEVYGTSAPINESVIGRIAKSYIELNDYKDSNAIKLPIYPNYDSSSKTLNLSLVNSELNLTNIQNFIDNGIQNNPIDVKLYYSPDDSISGNIPIAIYLFEGSDAIASNGESYFLLEFDIKVTSQNGINNSATQTFEFADGAISAKFVSNGVAISKNYTNSVKDKIIIKDDSGDAPSISQPASLDLKITKLISFLTNDGLLANIKSFFKDGETYTYKIDFGSGFSVVDFDRNTVDVIEGSFKVSDQPTYAINVNDISIDEGNSKDLCFYRPSAGDLSATSFDLSFTLRERPGRGAYDDDFTLSSNTISFSQGETEKCISVIANNDVHFDWIHYAYLDISQPSNGQKLSRDRVRISIVDLRGRSNRSGFLFK